MVRSDQPQPAIPPAVVRQFAVADPAAFARVHDRFAPGLLAMFARRARGDSTIADDLAQQVWTHVWRAVGDRRYDIGRAAVSTFVYAIANNVWRQHLQRNSRPTPTGSARIVANPGAEAIMLQAELLDALRACLHEAAGANALTDQERTIVLRSAQGETERALAAELSLAASTIHVRKEGAFAKLRCCMMLKGYSAESIEQIAAELE